MTDCVIIYARDASFYTFDYLRHRAKIYTISDINLSIVIPRLPLFLTEIVFHTF